MSTKKESLQAYDEICGLNKKLGEFMERHITTLSSDEWNKCLEAWQLFDKKLEEHGEVINS